MVVLINETYKLRSVFEYLYLCVQTRCFTLNTVYLVILKDTNCRRLDVAFIILRLYNFPLYLAQYGRLPVTLLLRNRISSSVD
jgi:hypothetical protein